MRYSWKINARRAIYLGGGALVACGLYLLGLMGSNNMHATIPGELYRSAQLNAQALDSYHHRYGIRSIINLRGENTGAAWYEAEKSFAESHAVALLNFRMSAKRRLDARQVRSLIALMEHAPKPVLIHCRQGADRTGLAVALYMAAIRHSDEGTAEAQLSPRFGHIPWISAARAMDATFEAMEPMLGYSNS